VIPDQRPEPFPPDLANLIAADRAQLVLFTQIVQAKVLGYFTGKGEQNLRIDIDAQTFTRQEMPGGDADDRENAPENNHREKTPAALPGR
jgi:hypothetical protein